MSEIELKIVMSSILDQNSEIRMVNTDMSQKFLRLFELSSNNVAQNLQTKFEKLVERDQYKIIYMTCFLSNVKFHFSINEY